MARNRSKKVKKLRRYRDQLIEKIVGLEAELRENRARFDDIKQAVQDDNPLRAMALHPMETSDFYTTRRLDKDQIIKEITLVYRMLIVERRYTEEVSKAARARDYLRVAALCEDHTAEVVAHDKMLTSWSQDHGFTRTLKEKVDDEDVA